MKKFLFLVVILFTAAKAQNTMFLPDTSGGAGDTISVLINVTNANQFVALQTDIQLPQEISFVANSAQLTSRSSGHVVSASLLTGNVLRLIAFSLNQTPFTGNTGSVVTFKVKLGKKPGIYPVLLINPIISNAQSQNILTGSANGNVTIFSPDIDLNFNQIDYGRVPWYTSGYKSFIISNTGTTPLLVNRIYSSGKYFVINSDTTKTIQPGGTHQVNIEFKSLKKGTYNETVTILSNDPDEPNITVNLSGTSFAVNELRFGTASGRSGYAIDLPVSVNNMEPFTGIQFDLLLPSVVKYSGGGAVLSSRKNDHVVSVNEVSPGRVRVIAFSPQNRIFADSLGELMKVRLTLDGTGGSYHIQPDSVFITDAAAVNIVSASYGNSVAIVSPDISGQQNIDLGEVSLPDTLHYTYTVYNNGSDTLHVDQITSSNPFYRVEYPSPFIVPQGGSKTFNVSFHSDQKGTNTTRLMIRSNDPDEDPFYVNLSVNAYAPNYIMVPDLITRSGDTVRVKININNHESFVAFQTDIKLPSGFTYINNSAVLTPRKADHILNLGTLGDNTFRLFAFSLSQQPFAGDSGAVAEMKFAVGTISGNFPVELTGGVISNAQSQNIIKAVQNGSITVYPVPAKPVLIAPANNTVNISTSPAFTWRTSAGLFKYRMQLSTAQTFNTIITDTTLSDTSITSKQLLSHTDYYWRVRGKNDGGSGEWSDIWKFTTIIQKPETPLLAAPVNNTKGIVPPINIKWHKSPRADRYMLQVSEFQNFSSLIFSDSLLTDSVAQVSDLRLYTQYYWRIKAINIGGESAWSDVWSFKTLGATYPVVLVSPVNQSVNLPVNGISFKWRKASERIETVLNYQFQLAEDSSFVVLTMNDSTLTDTSAQVSNLRYGTGYYWRVRASNETGWGDWSQTWSLSTIIEKPVIPALASPSSNSVGVIQPLILKWYKSLRAEKYKLEVATDSAFTDITNIFSDLTDTLRVLPVLPAYTKHYWRVKASNPGGESGWSLVFNFKTIGSPYGVTLSQPANQSVNNPVNGLTFKWKKPAERIETIFKYQFQLAEDSSFVVLTMNDSTLTDTSAQVNNLRYGTGYFWRVRAANETGWGDWSRIWSFTTIIEKPAVPLPASPANNSAGLIQPITVKWNQSLRGEKYKLQVALVPDFSTVIYSDTLLTDTLKQLPLLANHTRCYWRVLAYNIGGESAWSDVWNFKTLGAAYPVVLTSPANQSLNHSVNGISFQWRKAAERVEMILKYQFQLAEDSLFVVLTMNDSTLTDTSAQVNNLRYGTGYYWRVRASNETGWGDWSVMWKFNTIIEKPAIPVLASPANNGVGLVQLVTLKWNESLRADTYKLQVSLQPDFITVVHTDTTLTDTVAQLPALANYTKHYWRVMAKNIGGQSEWSQAFNFRTLGQPYSASLVFPENQTNNLPVNGLIFKWRKGSERIETILKYQFQLAEDSLFSTLTRNDSSLTDTSVQVNNLRYEWGYFWRVRSLNETGWGDWSQVWNFNTIIEKPAVPLLASPVNNAAGLVQPIIVKWHSSLRAEKYKLQVSLVSDFTTLIYSDTLNTDTLKQLPPLADHTVHYWRVMAQNAGGQSGWSSVFNFKTLGSPYSVQLSEPVNNSISQPVNGLTFKWRKAAERVETILKYQFQLAEDSLFVVLTMNDSTLTDTSAQVNNLRYDWKYFWRVRAKNETGWGDWSVVWKFRTEYRAISAPTNLTAANDGYRRVKLNWNDNSDNELGFAILRKHTTGQDTLFRIINTVSANAVTYTDTTVGDSATYTYVLYAFNEQTVSDSSNWASVTTLVDVKEFAERHLPADFYVDQNYPNPFNPGTVIRFGLPREDNVDLSVFDVSGKLVRKLVSGRFSAGSHTAGWDGRDDYGAAVPSGIYLYRLRTDAFVQTKKLILLK